MKQKFNISNLDLRPFFIGLLGVLLMSVLHATGITKKVHFVSPLSQTAVQEDFFQTVRPLLERFKDNYQVYKKTSFIPQTNAAESMDYDNATSYVVVDYDTGEILVEKSSNKKVPIASLTKVMTAVIALDLALPSEYFSVTPRASHQIPSKLGVKPGERLQVQELLEGALMTSANDAAQALADGVDTKYGEQIFVKSMNAKASYLDLSDTHFENPQGFDDPNHYSSAHDLALLTHYALKNYPKIAEIVQKDFDYLPKDDNHKLYKLPNWNGLLGVYPNVSGVKIGNTDDAGKTTIVLSEREGKKILVVLLGAPGLYERDLWAADLLNLGFSQTLGLEPVVVTKKILQEKYNSWYEKLREE